MKLFITWSGERSKAIATALRDWIPNVIQAVKPWMSEEDIAKGRRWGAEVARELDESKAGIVCLTPESLDSRWVLFEAGALSKSVSDAYVCTYLVGLQPSDVPPPLGHFQATKAEMGDTRKLLQTINAASGAPLLEPSRLDTIFETWWPKLEGALKAVHQVAPASAPERSEKEILKEILEILRQQQRMSNVRSAIEDFMLERFNSPQEPLEVPESVWRSRVPRQYQPAPIPRPPNASSLAEDVSIPPLGYKPPNKT